MKLCIDFFVPTFQCLQSPLIYFDGFISSTISLSAFHFKSMSDKCHLYTYTCDLHMTKFTINNSNSTNLTFHETNTINVNINSPSLYTQRISYEQDIKPTNFVDRIHEKV